MITKVIQSSERNEALTYKAKLCKNTNPQIEQKWKENKVRKAAKQMDKQKGKFKERNKKSIFKHVICTI